MLAPLDINTKVCDAMHRMPPHHGSDHEVEKVCMRGAIVEGRVVNYTDRYFDTYSMKALLEDKYAFIFETCIIAIVVYVVK